MSKGTYLPDYWWKANGLPVPTPEYRFDPTRKWRVDYAFLGRVNLAVEIEGGVWTRGRHVHPSGFEKDMEKYNKLTELGFKLLRYRPNHVDAEQIRRVLCP